MDYIHVGKIVATHGVQGDIIITHALNKKTDLKNIEALFVEESKDSYIPYFIEKAKAKNEEEIICKLEGINSKESAHRFIRKNVWLAENDFAKIADGNTPIALLGYLVINEDEPLSKVEEVIEQPHQLLLRIVLNEKDVFIPIHEETLDKIDRKKQEIHVTLPDGLLDIYLED
ncbi:ribosome maturation factor RimM [Arachidicoccus ginsenosidimutans]|uniref:ribosome maturation factor RimM n=1 Tax=Arachidicoccus sp. BS20 TaxID=1850526 RepID=UPI001E3A1667|nr:ribosome maturation factor RimM [Arachidicoccus sp. BS20]